MAVLLEMMAAFQAQRCSLPLPPMTAPSLTCLTDWPGIPSPSCLGGNLWSVEELVLSMGIETDASRGLPATPAGHTCTF